MTMTKRGNLRKKFVFQVKEYGGTLAGIAQVEDLKTHLPCMSACPQKVFRNGRYDREFYQIQIKTDEDNVSPIPINPEIMHLSYCRACELSCPVAN